MRKTMQARRRYGSLVGALGLASIALAGCGDYWVLAEAVKHGAGKHDPKPGEPPPPPPTSDGGAPVCVDLSFDHDVACEDAVAAKDQAGAECQKRGLELATFGPGSCIAGDVLRLKYSCCPKAPAPPPPPPTSDGGGSACVDLAFDHDLTCEDVGMAGKDQAWAECRKRGFQLTAFGPASCAAGDLVRLKYTCCPESEAPPPQTGSTLPLQTAHYAQYRCCDSSRCLVQQLGGASVCEDTASFTAEASAACAHTGGTLSGVYLYAACTP